MDNTLEQFTAQIHHAAHHAVEEAMGSPAAINRSVGESMRHMGQLLMSQSTSYLPVRKEEILTEPHRLHPNSLQGVVLVNRQIRSENAFLLLITVSGEGDERQFTLVGFREDPFNLSQTKFMKIPPNVVDELVRQARIIINGEGVAILQAVLIEKYFELPPPGAAPEENDLFSSDLSPEEPQPAPPAPAHEQSWHGKALPPVEEHLL